MGSRRASELRAYLDAAYGEFNRKEFIHPDPLELVLGYEDPDDREVAGLVAASLALGTVKGILAGAGDALARLSPSPAKAIDAMGRKGLAEAFSGFRYRFFSGDDVSSLLGAVAALRGRYGSLGARLRELSAGTDARTIAPALALLVRELRDASGSAFKASLFPSPEDGSACKRPFLFLRWMARKDRVDPGVWARGIEPLLMLPLDTHMERAGRSLGLLRRKGNGIKAAMELTESFRRLNPEDPVKYDFALTRPGINPRLRADPGQD
jgi:uncharacterized protein (TIGR02757 family)